MRLVLGVAAVAVLAASTGCERTQCGKGTFRDGKTCRPFDPDETTPPVVSVDPPVRTRFVDDVTLTTNEPATIYYTTDGSTPTVDSLNEPDEVVIPDLPDDAQIAFFAVDRAGNASEVVYFQWEIDRTGPGVPRSFDIQLSGNQRTLSWVNPATDDLVGIIVARVEGRLAAPVAETAYTVGDEIAPGVTVVYASAATANSAGSFTESQPALPGMIRYAAWTYDDLGNYGTAAADHELVDIPPQIATITVNAATGAVSVPQGPEDIGLSGTATFDAGTLTLELDVENLTTRALFAPKVLMTNLTGTAGNWSDSDGTFETKEYRALGAAIAPGQVVTGEFTFTGVGGTDILTMDVDLRWGRAIATTAWQNGAAGYAHDEATESEILALGATGLMGNGNSSGSPGLRAGGITPDGFYLMGARNHPQVLIYDLGTGERVSGFRVTEERGSTSRLLLDRGGATAYVLLLHGHSYGSRYSGVEAEILRVDPFGLQVNGRTSIGHARGSADMELSPDGRRLAITAVDRIVVVDLESLVVAARLDFPMAGAVAWNADGNLVGVGIGEARTYDAQTWEVLEAVDLPTDSSWSPYAAKVRNAGFARDGRLWIGRGNDVQAVDLSDGTDEIFGLGGATLEVFDGEVFTVNGCSSTIYHLDTAGNVVTQYNLSDSHCSHGLARSPF